MLGDGSPRNSSKTNSLIVGNNLMSAPLSTKNSNAQKITLKSKIGITQIIKPKTKVTIIKRKI